MRADLRHRHALGKAADLGQHHPLAGGHSGLQTVGIMRLDADHLDLGAQVFDVGSDAGDQAAATDRHEDRIQLARLLAEDLHGHGALAGDHVRVVERRHEGRAFAVGQLQGMGQGVGEAFAVQHHLATARTHAFNLEFRGSGRHNDGGAHAQLASRQGDTLGMVAGRSGDHPALALGRAQATEAGIGTADLEGKGRLQVFALEQHLVAQAARQGRRRLQGRFDRQVVNRGRKNAPHVVGQQAQRRGRCTGANGKAGHR
ncbi:hypothetical protein D9M71_552550 [compost metagenome]